MDYVAFLIKEKRSYEDIITFLKEHPNEDVNTGLNELQETILEFALRIGDVVDITFLLSYKGIEPSAGGLNMCYVVCNDYWSWAYVMDNREANISPVAFQERLDECIERLKYVVGLDPEISGMNHMQYPVYPFDSLVRGMPLNVFKDLLQYCRVKPRMTIQNADYLALIDQEDKRRFTSLATLNQLELTDLSKSKIKEYLKL